MKKVSIIILLVILTNSCVKTIDIDMPMDEPKQVLNCLFTADKVIKVSLSKSVSITDFAFSDVIDSANITLFEDDVEIETLTYDAGYYKSSILPQINKKYKLLSVVAGLKTVTAEDIVPSEPIINDVEFIEEAYYDASYGVIYGKTTIAIEDDGLGENFYEIAIVRTYFDEYSEETIVRATGIQSSSNSLILNEIDEQGYPTHLVFSDDSFNGDTTPLTFDFANHFEDNLTPISYKVIIRSITEDYYKYKRRLNRHTYFREGNIWDALIEPLHMYTNIDNGFGVLAGYNEYNIEF